MRFNLLIIIILIFATNSCEKEESIDPVIGTWKLVDKSVNGTLVEMSECLSRNNLEFHIDNKVTFNIYFEDENTGNCEFESSIEKWNAGSNNYYAVHSGSLFNQNREFKIIDSQLIYSYEAWNFIDNQIITTDLILYYEKK